MTFPRVTIDQATSLIIDHRGKTPKKLGADWTISGHRVISAQNIKGSRIDENDHHYVDSRTYAKWMKVPLAAGDTLLTSEAPLGEVAYLQYDVDWVLGQRLYALRTEPSLAVGRFLFYALQSPLVRNDLESRATGTTVFGISQVELRKVQIPCPPIVEQRRIAGVLGALDDKIESNLRTISLSESLILAHFSQLFNSGHVSAGTALSDLMEVNPRYSLKRESLAIKVSMQDIPSDSPIINTHSVMPVGAGSRFSNGDVLFARISPCLENGKTAVVDFLSGSEVGFGSTEFIVLSPRGEISTTWIYALARDPNFREACRQAMSGSSGRQRLSADFFSRYTIATPKESDLVAFNEATMPLLTFMGARRDENQRLAQLRDALLPELMSGRMRVDEAGCLVSEALDEEVRSV